MINLSVFPKLIPYLSYEISERLEQRAHEIRAQYRETALEVSYDFALDGWATFELQLACPGDGAMGSTIKIREPLSLPQARVIEGVVFSLYTMTRKRYVLGLLETKVPTGWMSVFCRLAPLAMTLVSALSKFSVIAPTYHCIENV